MKVDVLVDVQRGDCGKGKISKILNDKKNYNIIAKYNGGGNAGHAVWIDGQKYTSHYLTSGMYDPNTNIVIGPGCVVNPDEFIKEYMSFESQFNLNGRVYIHPYTHIITDKHIKLDSKDTKIGTTKKGIGPAYSDKYARKNKRAYEIEELEPFLLPTTNILDLNPYRVLMEGSQGWWLDIDYGSYPFVTSSHIHPGFAFTTFGIPLKYYNKVYGVAKIYETYVGNAIGLIKCDEKEEKIIREAGNEYGETTGRPRQIGYLNINDLIEACNQCGVDDLFINKCDVLMDVGIFKAILDDQILEFHNIVSMTDYVKQTLLEHTKINNIYFGFSKEGDDLK